MTDLARRDISRYAKCEFRGLYGMRWTFDISAMRKDGWFADELMAASRLSAILKEQRGRKK